MNVENPSELDLDFTWRTRASTVMLICDEFLGLELELIFLINNVLIVDQGT